MAKGLGIAGLVIAIVAIFVPVVALHMMWLALIVVTVAALFGDRTFTVASWVITVVNLLFLSPLTVLALIGEHMGAQQTGGSAVLLLTTVVLFAAPIVAIILNATGKVALTDSADAKRSGVETSG